MHLQTLPSEIRAQIWDVVFQNSVAIPRKTPLEGADIEYCEPCHPTPHPQSAEPLSEIIRPLLICRQAYSEALPSFYTNLSLFLNSESDLSRFYAASPRSLARNLRSLILITHIDLENCLYWNDSLTKFFQSLGSLSLTSIDMRHHMRPPSSYENLWPGIYYIAPMLKQPQPPPRSLDITMHFDYRSEYVMFESPFLGEVKCSDALEEHEMVLRELLDDEQFRDGVQGEDDEDMTQALERVARKHERSWFRSLQRRRMAQLSPEDREALELALAEDDED